MGRHLFDLDPSFLTGHDHQLALGPIQRDSQVQLALDIAGFFHQHLLDLLPLRTGLVGHQLHAENLFGRLPHLIGP